MKLLLIGDPSINEVCAKYNCTINDIYVIADLPKRMIYKKLKVPHVYYIADANNVEDYKLVLEELDMKFDKVIMNPPYNGNLHINVLQEVCKHAKSIVSLEPNDFLVDCLYKDKYNIASTLDGHISSAKMIDKNYMMKAFPQTTFNKDACIIKLDMVKDNLKSVDDYKDKIQQKIIRKITKFDNLQNHYDLDKEKYFIKIPFIHGHQGKADMYEVVSPKCAINDESTSGYHVYFKTKAEAENLLKSFKLRSYRYIYKCFKKSINNDPTHLVWLEDYTKEWTDKDIYKLFNITKEEQKIIEDTMAQYETTTK